MQAPGGAAGTVSPATVAVPTPAVPSQRMDDNAKQRLVEGLVMCALTWTLGATGDDAGRTTFDATLRWGALGARCLLKSAKTLG